MLKRKSIAQWCFANIVDINQHNLTTNSYNVINLKKVESVIKQEKYQGKVDCKYNNINTSLDF